jgi:flagella basal body P-ring formation protein FlgA
VTIHVQENATVSATVIQLGDISKISGASPEVGKALKRIVIGKSPRPSQFRELRGAFVKARIEQSQVELPYINLVIPNRVTVEREYVEVSEDEMGRIVTQFILANMPWDPRQVTVKDIKARAMVLPPGRLSYEIRPQRNEDYVGPTSFCITFKVGGEAERKAWVNAYIQVMTPVMVATRRLGKHESISEADVRLETADLFRLPQDVLIDGEEIIGKRTKVPVGPNLCLRRSWIELPLIVKRGDIVTIVAESGLLTITTKGLIKENGRKGDVVRVTNIGSNREVYARVLDETRVTVDF